MTVADATSASAFGQSGQAVADAGGTARVFVFGPRRVGTLWRIGQVILRGTVATATTACTANVYRTAEIPGLLLGTSLLGNADTMTGLPGDELSPGDQLLVICSGLVPGSTYFVNMTGVEVLL